MIRSLTMSVLATIWAIVLFLAGLLACKLRTDLPSSMEEAHPGGWPLAP